ncbi:MULTISPECIES: hypothetical protein [Syntrophotalea]|jgi:hypothetical protein|uniref:Uncharacterized protein n=1 Tax=Syntrophotalea acetylenica TaxID=29542 RepID=A0A1L3GFE3_SYNAC|nr:hypothetical protein [Syntrophotalea acetylenica]APG24569.1 hypothetical protein A7E75_05650 [Syntrophotalea acetylenica]APG45153.1 hypothetical protein A6070_14280 [Syntrophotalea acetylenica]MDY0262796.1 hypothetical protein [Syntrophotalea acetylenica]
MPDKRFLWTMGLLALLLLASACAAGSSARALLQEDYAAMNNQELLIYYDQLNAAIAKQEGGAGGFGFGVGLGVGSGSFSVGASQGTYIEDPTEALRQQRNRVRLELARRGLQPADSTP